jgi:hypothetical protein
MNVLLDECIDQHFRLQLPMIAKRLSSPDSPA